MIPPILLRGAIVAAAIAGPKLLRTMRGRGFGSSAVGGRGASRRREEVFAWAIENGWHYDFTEQEVPGLWYSPPFGMGRNRKAQDVITGMFHGKHAASFTYEWSEESNSSGFGIGSALSAVSSGPQLRRTMKDPPRPVATGERKQVHVIAMDIPTWVPIVHFIPRTIADTLVWKRDEEHVAVESARFNDAWRVRSRNVKFAHSLLHPRYIDRMLYPDAVGRNIRFEGKSILCIFDGPTKVENIMPTLLLLTSMVDLVPDFIWQEYR